jgi:hypothetical protein
MPRIIAALFAFVALLTSVPVMAAEPCRVTGFEPSETVRTSDIEMRAKVHLGMTRLEVDSILRDDIDANHVASRDRRDFDSEIYVISDRGKGGLFALSNSTAIFHFTYGDRDRLTAMCTLFFNTGP